MAEKCILTAEEASLSGSEVLIRGCRGDQEEVLFSKEWVRAMWNGETAMFATRQPSTSLYLFTLDARRTEWTNARYPLRHAPMVLTSRKTRFLLVNDRHC